MVVEIGSGLLDKALALIAEEGYATFTLARLASHAGVPLADVYRAFPARTAVMTELGARIDAAMEAGAPSGTEGTARDRIFDLVMTRLELLAPYKNALLVFARELPRVPQDAIGAARGLDHASRRVLTMAGLDAGGVRGQMRVQSLTAIYARVLKRWIDDDDPGLAPTMALLDRWLRRAENLTPNFWG